MLKETTSSFDYDIQFDDDHKQESDYDFDIDYNFGSLDSSYYGSRSERYSSGRGKDKKEDKKHSSDSHRRAERPRA